MSGRRPRGPVASFLVGACLWLAAVVVSYLLVIGLAVGFAGLLLAFA